MAGASVLERMNGLDGLDHLPKHGNPLDALKDAPFALVVQVAFDHPSPDSNPPSWYQLNPENLGRFTEALQCSTSARTCGGTVNSASSHGAAASGKEEKSTAGRVEEEEEDEDSFEDAEEDEFEEAEEGGEGKSDVAADVAEDDSDRGKHIVWCTFSWGGGGTQADDSTEKDDASVEAAGKEIAALLHVLANQESPARIKAVSTSDGGDALLNVVQGQVADLRSQGTESAPLSILFEFSASTGESPEDVRLGVNWVEFPGTVPRGSTLDPDPRNCWMIPHKSSFMVKSETFFEDGVKTDDGAPLCELVAVDWLHVAHPSERISHVCAREGGVVRRVMERHGEKAPFFVVVNLQVPGGSNGHYSMSFYFAIEQDSPEFREGSLLHKFINVEDDEWRTHRLGLIPAIPEGSWLIRNAVGNGTVVTLGEALNLSFVKAEGYFEIDVNMGTSSVVSGILGLVVPCMSILTVDLAFFIKAEEGDPLPEKLFGVVRCCNLEQSSAVEMS